jgi:hypothetical protein
LHVLTLNESAWRAMSDAAYATAAAYTWESATTMFEGALCLAIRRALRGR